jgi:Cu/Ag efflux protein CusF
MSVGFFVVRANTHHMNAWRRAVLAGGVFAMVSTGCSREPAAPVRGAPDHTYSVRGLVEMIPAKDKPTAEFVVHHEPIPEFVNPNGTKGMPAMSMPFPLAKGVSIEGVKVGDAVELTFNLWTTPGVRGFEVTQVRTLPAGTTLNFVGGAGKGSGGQP